MIENNINCLCIQKRDGIKIKRSITHFEYVSGLRVTKVQNVSLEEEVDNLKLIIMSLRRIDFDEVERVDFFYFSGHKVFSLRPCFPVFFVEEELLLPGLKEWLVKYYYDLYKPKNDAKP